MGYTILLYGATGFSGRLIAAEGQRAGMSREGDGRYRMILAGRNGAALEKLACERKMDFRAFRVDDPPAVARGFNGVHVVINAAGPFAVTAFHLARGAVLAGCNYVDINGELDVYKALEDVGRFAEMRHVAMVGSAGHIAAASNLLLRAALQLIPSLDVDQEGPTELGAIRFALSRITSLSRGSMETVCHSLREQVAVIRQGEVDDGHGGTQKGLVVWHEPVGKLEREFTFCDDDAGTRRAHKKPGPRIATAANLVDTLAARLTVVREKFAPHRIESYVEAGRIARLWYQLGALWAPLAANPIARELTRLQSQVLSIEPTPQDLEDESHSLVLEIDDPFRTRIVDWCWHTPNPYQFTAQVVVEIARAVASPQTVPGWRTPSEILRPSREELTARTGYLRGCTLYARTTPSQGSTRERPARQTPSRGRKRAHPARQRAAR